VTVAGRRKAAAVSAVAEGGSEPDAARPSFDLHSEPWIPIVRGGVEELVSLRTAITDAHKIDGLSTTDGPRFAGLLRLLVALVMDVYGQPANDREWAKQREQGRFDAAKLDDYVATVGRSRFDLFDAEHPFMQSATTPDEGKTVAELLPHVASGNRTPLFTPDTDATPRPLTFAQAAQALVAAQVVAVGSMGRAAGDDPPESWAGASFFGRAGIIGFCCPVGESLFETLLVNIPSGGARPHTAQDSTDLPVWRRSDVPHSRRKRHSDGIVDLLTWTPRRVRLVPEGETVSRVCFRGGDALPNLELSHEPHTALRRSDGKGPGSPPAGQWYPRKHLPHTIGWRGIPQLLALSGHDQDSQAPMVLQHLGNRLELLQLDYRVTVLSMYVEYGQMSAVIDDIATDVFPLPVRAFGKSETDIRDLLAFLVDTADRVRYQLRSYAADVYAVTHRDLEKDRKASKAYASAVEAELVSRIDTITRRLLSKLSANPGAMEELRQTWNAELGALADAAVTEINTDCGPDVFALIGATTSAGRSTVGVYPPAIRQAQLNAKLAPLLGRDH
jgi:CRISPR system Cascade subunit CasA